MQTIEEILQQANFYSDGENYRIIQLPSKGVIAAAGVLAEVGEPFAALLLDKDEVTLVLDDEAYQEYHERLLGHRTLDTLYRLITIDVELEPTLVGFMAYLSTALAQANVSILPFAAFARDHILVPSEKYEVALHALNQLKTK